MSVKASSVVAGNCEYVDPEGGVHPVTLISFDPGTGNAVYQLQRSFNYLENGAWTLRTSATSPVEDDSSNPAVSLVTLGQFNVNIPTPADTTPPVGAMVGTIPDITVAGAHTIPATITWTDPA